MLQTLKISKGLIFILVFLISLCLSVQAQEWEQMSTIDFDRNHGIGFAIGQYGYVLTGGDSKTDNTTFQSKSFNRYDSTTDTWEEMADYPGPSRGFGIGEVYEDKLYFGFGRDGNGNSLNDLWSYDPATEEFIELPSCPCVGRTHPAFLATEGKLYMGTGSSSGNLSDWWEYDIEAQLWIQRANIPGARHHPYQFVIDGEAYVGSGHRETWFKYDAENDAWIQLANLDDRVAGTQFGYNGRGYALSGVDNDHDSYSVGEFWQYIPEVDSWVALESHPGISRWAPASFIIDGYAYLVTGWGPGTSGPIADRSVWRYNLEEQNPSAIKGEENTVNFAIYPNPTRDILTIDIKEGKELTSGKIIDLEGKQIIDIPAKSEFISVRELVAGTYWIYFEIDNQTYKKVFIKR